MAPAEDSDLAETSVSKKPKKESLSAEVPSPAPSTIEKSDTQLINELLKAEGFSFPEPLDDKVKGKCRETFILSLTPPGADVF